MFPLTPALSLKGEGVVRAGIILWGSLSPQGEGENRAYQAALFFFLNGFFAPPTGAAIPRNRFTGVLRA